MAKPEKSQSRSATVSDQTLNRFMGYHMKRAFNVVQSDLSDTLKQFDLRMLTFTALTLIRDNPGLSQSQLADAMDIERPNMVVIVDELERRDLIQRDRVPTDRRAYALSVTLAGGRLCDKAIEAINTHEDRLFAGLDQDTRQLMIEALASIRSNDS